MGACRGGLEDWGLPVAVGMDRGAGNGRAGRLGFSLAVVSSDIRIEIPIQKYISNLASQEID